MLLLAALSAALSAVVSPARSATVKSVLSVGQRLGPGGALSSPSGRYMVLMQADGNFVEYDANDGLPLWSTATRGSGGAFVILQADGNLVAYTSTGKPVWSSVTAGQPAARLILQDDGNLVLYTASGKATWSSGIVLEDTLLAGMTLHAGQQLATQNHAYTAVMQSDGNFVIYAAAGGPVWWTGTSGQANAYLIYQTDGNVVLYSATGSPLWSTSTFGLVGRFTMQTDGNLVVYDNTGNPEWWRLSSAPNGVVGDSATWNLAGRGNGHGHGLSQWGAYGAAAAGLTWQQIVAFYYPGTALSTVPSTTQIRVKLDRDSSNGVVQVVNSPGTQVVDSSDSATWTFPGYSRLRAVFDTATGRQRLQGLNAASVWVNIDLPGRALFNGQAEFANSGTQIVRLVYTDGSSTDFRGRIVATNSGQQNLFPVNYLNLDSYVQGVVPREMPSSWATNALRAQAVAVRTYALYEVQHSAGQVYDICSTTNCQVYGGVASYDAAGNLLSGEVASTNSAVAATSDVVLTYGGNAAFAQFAAADGGYTVDGGQPYLTAHPDPYDGYLNNSEHAWTAQLSAGQLKAAYPQLAHLEWVSITSRTGQGDFGGRVNTMVVRGIDASRQPVQLTLTGNQVASLAGLNTNWFAFTGS